MAGDNTSPEVISLKRAREEGLRHYFTGLPCQRGHVSDRLVSDRSCLDCGREKTRRYYVADPERGAALMRDWRARNPGKASEANKRWRKANPEKVAALQKRQMKNNLQHRLGSYLRRRLLRAIRDGAKAGSAVRDLGCSVPELVAHLEARFAEGMSWANWGLVWQIDHRLPLADFDLTDREQFLAASHWSNLQPLFKADHHYKTGAENRTRILCPNPV